MSDPNDLEGNPADPRIVGLERLLDANRPLLPARGAGVEWPDRRDQLRRAGKRNAERGIEAWNRKRLGVRRAGHAGGWREPPVIGAPRLYISYRWEEDVEHEAWVDRLAGELFGRGYDVTFDRHPETLDDSTGPDESFFRIASCTVFLAVITDAYVNVISKPQGNKSPWSAREWTEATQLQRQGQLAGDPDDPKIIGIWRSGSRLPPGLSPERVLDFRAMPNSMRLLDTMFPELDVILEVHDRGRSFEVGPLHRRDIRNVMETIEPEAFVQVRARPTSP